MADPLLRQHGGFGVGARLQALRAEGLFRWPITVDGPQGPRIHIGGREFLNFCSNDYLSLAADARVVAALQDGAAHYGAGAGASQLVCGRSCAHRELELALAGFLGRDRALVFSSGYLANLAVASALITGRNDLVAEDRLNHASLIDAGLLSRARLRRYTHADPGALEAILRGADRRKLVLTDGVFSMDGDVAPLQALAAVCARQQALLVVDDAHGFGVLGEHGRGSLEEAGIPAAEIPLVVGTFGKALGTGGAFIAATDEIVELLIQRARPYIYTTAPPPALMVATREALRILISDRPHQRLGARIAYFRRRAGEAGVPVRDSTTAIQPLILGDAAAALGLSARLYEMGIYVAAIRPPTVPANSSRLRITLNAGHSEADINRLVAALAEGLSSPRAAATS